jgi:hypothetical protein
VQKPRDGRYSAPRRTSRLAVSHPVRKQYMLISASGRRHERNSGSASVFLVFICRTFRELSVDQQLNKSSSGSELTKNWRSYAELCRIRTNQELKVLYKTLYLVGGSLWAWRVSKALGESELTLRRRKYVKHQTFQSALQGRYIEW